SEAMRGIKIAVALGVRITPPQSFAAVFEHDLAQVVVVRSLAVQQLPEHSGTNHVQDQRFAVSVAAVLHDHAVTARFFRGVHNLLALYDGVYGGDLDAGMCSALQGGYRH